MVELTEKLVSHIRNTSKHLEIRANTKKHIRRKLEGEFGTSLVIFPNDNGKLIIIPYNLRATKLAGELAKMEREIKSLKEDSDPLDLVGKAALYISDEMKKTQEELNLEWPQKLDMDYLPLTPFITVFFKTLVAGNPDKPLTFRVNRFIYSVYQDCMFAISGGSCLTAKHILLPWAVKSLTGNVDVFKLLNRLGHGISYSKLEEIETALCMEKL